MSRPLGKKGDTGVLWSGMHRGASESLIHATRDDDARCVIVLATEAIEAGAEAIKIAKNPRQVSMTSALIEAAHRIKTTAEQVIADGGQFMP